MAVPTFSPSTWHGHQQERRLLLVSELHIVRYLVFHLCRHVHGRLINAVWYFFKCASSDRFLDNFLQTLVLQGRWQPVHSSSVCFPPELLYSKETQRLIDLACFPGRAGGPTTYQRYGSSCLQTWRVDVDVLFKKKKFYRPPKSRSSSSVLEFEIADVEGPVRTFPGGGFWTFKTGPVTTIGPFKSKIWRSVPWLVWTRSVR